MAQYQQIGVREEIGVRQTGKTVTIPYYSIAKYNYSMKCFRVPYEHNDIVAAFRGKLLPIKTVKLEGAPDDYNNWKGTLFNVVDWVIFLVSFGMVISLNASPTICTVPDFAYYSNNCVSKYNNVDGYNNNIKQQQSYTKLLLSADVIFTCIYSVLMLYIFYNLCYSKSITVLSLKVNDNVSLGDTINQFIAISREKYYQLSGVQIDQESATLYGINFQTKNELHCHLYKSDWYYKYVTLPRRLLIVSWIIYCIFLHYSITAYDNWKNVQTI